MWDFMFFRYIKAHRMFKREPYSFKYLTIGLPAYLYLNRDIKTEQLSWLLSKTRIQTTSTGSAHTFGIQGWNATGKPVLITKHATSVRKTAYLVHELWTENLRILGFFISFYVIVLNTGTILLRDLGSCVCKEQRGVMSWGEVGDDEGCHVRTHVMSIVLRTIVYLQW